MGIKYTDALSGSIWQNTIPIFTLVMGLLSGLEKIDMRPHGMAKLAGAPTRSASFTTNIGARSIELLIQWWLVHVLDTYAQGLLAP